MTVLDTSIVIDRVKLRKRINEDITVVTFIEFPKIIYYKYFYGGVIFPIRVQVSSSLLNIFYYFW